MKWKFYPCIVFLVFLSFGVVQHEVKAQEDSKNKNEKYSSHDSSLIKRRHIPMDGQNNFRDLGGYPTKDGRKVKWGKFYRSGELNRLTPDDVNRIDSLKIKYVIDFRSTYERDERGLDHLPPDVKYDSLSIDPVNFSNLVIPAFQEANPDLMPDSILYHLNTELIANFTPVFKEFVQKSLIQSENPVLLHCTSGKDRTGIASALLLSILGVPWKIVKDDYELSNFYRKTDNEKQMAALQKSFADANQVPVSKIDMKKFKPLFVVDGDYLDAAYAQIIHEYGSLNNYIRKGLGVSDKERKKLQELYTD